MQNPERMQGTPQNMHTNPVYDDVVKDILYYFSEKIAELRSKGVNDLIADVGFGFGKTLDQNYRLLNHLELFKNLEIPVLAGLSRKSKASSVAPKSIKLSSPFLNSL